jgi:hypothetical protein
MMEMLKERIRIGDDYTSEEIESNASQVVIVRRILSPSQSPRRFLSLRRGVDKKNRPVSYNRAISTHTLQEKITLSTL